MTTTPPPRGFGIDPRLGAAALRAPAASREDYRPQAILNLFLHEMVVLFGSTELNVFQST